MGIAAVSHGPPSWPEVLPGGVLGFCQGGVGTLLPGRPAGTQHDTAQKIRRQEIKVRRCLGTLRGDLRALLCVYPR